MPLDQVKFVAELVAALLAIPTFLLTLRKPLWRLSRRLLRWLDGILSFDGRWLARLGAGESGPTAPCLVELLESKDGYVTGNGKTMSLRTARYGRSRAIGRYNHDEHGKYAGLVQLDVAADGKTIEGRWFHYSAAQRTWIEGPLECNLKGYDPAEFGPDGAQPDVPDDPRLRDALWQPKGKERAPSKK